MGLPRERVGECQPPGMQGLAVHVGRRLSAVQRISNKGMPDVRHVHTDLVRAARMQNAAHQASLGILVQTLESGLRRLARLATQVNNRHAQTVDRVATNGGIDPYAGAARPVTKTTEDYLREAERAKRSEN